MIREECVLKIVFLCETYLCVAILFLYNVISFHYLGTCLRNLYICTDLFLILWFNIIM